MPRAADTPIAKELTVGEVAARSGVAVSVTPSKPKKFSTHENGIQSMSIFNGGCLKNDFGSMYFRPLDVVDGEYAERRVGITRVMLQERRHQNAIQRVQDGIQRGSRCLAHRA